MSPSFFLLEIKVLWIAGRDALRAIATTSPPNQGINSEESP